MNKREERKSRAKDTSKPPGGSATAESTTRNGGRGGVKEGRRGTEPPDTETPDDSEQGDSDHGGHRQGARGGHSGCWHPKGARSSLDSELDVLRKRGKSVSPTEYTFSESFMNGRCKKTKSRVQVQTPTKDPESQMLGLGWFSVFRRRGGR